MEYRNKIYDLITAKRKLDQTEQDIRKYNRADTVNMNPEESNKFRHIAGSAWLTSRYYTPAITELLGNTKEIWDRIRKGSWTDKNIDLQNNKIGIDIGDKNQGINQKTIFDYIFKTEIEPNRK